MEKRIETKNRVLIYEDNEEEMKKRYEEIGRMYEKLLNRMGYCLWGCTRCPKTEEMENKIREMKIMMILQGAAIACLSLGQFLSVVFGN